MTTDIIAQAGEVEEIRLQRGLAYLGLNEAAAARVEIEKALAANPRFTEAAAILESLQP
jgi:Tfp pilus assembly protein PilF